MSLSRRENKGERTEERKKKKRRENRHGGNSKKMLRGNVQKPT